MDKQESFIMDGNMQVVNQCMARHILRCLVCHLLKVRMSQPLEHAELDQLVFKGGLLCVPGDPLLIRLIHMTDDHSLPWSSLVFLVSVSDVLMLKSQDTVRS